MIRPIMKDPLFLAGKSRDAVMTDLPIAMDLKDTLHANRDICAGMAANMIGFRVRIICITAGPSEILMLNPVIISRKKPYETEEGCLSLSGMRKTIRYETITVRYQDTGFRQKTGSYSGFAAQVIQHEIDHCSGILI